jgi:hypothetical protein
MDEGIDNDAYTILANRCEMWKDLARAYADLLVCYRVGKQPAGKTLDKIRRLKEQLGES